MGANINASNVEAAPQLVTTRLWNRGCGLDSRMMWLVLLMCSMNAPPQLQARGSRGCKQDAAAVAIKVRAPGSPHRLLSCPGSDPQVSAGLTASHQSTCRDDLGTKRAFQAERGVNSDPGSYTCSPLTWSYTCVQSPVRSWKKRSTTNFTPTFLSTMPVSSIEAGAAW